MCESCCANGHGHHAHGEECHEEGNGRMACLRLGLSALVLFAGLIKEGCFSPFSEEWVRVVWYVAAYLPVGLPVMAEALGGMRHGDVFNEFTLMSVATVGAFAIGEYPEGVSVMLFYSLGEMFQDRAVGSARRSIKALLDVRPETAAVVDGDHVRVVPPKDVRPGQVIEVVAGGRVPLDGVLLSDEASFDTSALTGESLPRTVARGGEVLAGMIAADRVVRLRVTRVFGESAISRILDMVQNASARKAPAELFIRRFARVYTPAVTGLAVLIVLVPWLVASVQGVPYAFQDWLYRALVFLVVSCPCALVVSIPLGYFGGIGAASRKGVLFKGGNYLDALAKVNTVVFDKTGTLTRGIFSVRQVAAHGPWKENDVLRFVAAAERSSSHPIAKAVVAHAERLRLSCPLATDTVEIAGQGLAVKLDDGHTVLAGNRHLMQAHGVDCDAEGVETDTVVYCAVDGRYAGCVSLADTLKDDARQAVDELKKLGIENIQVLSGDRQEIVTKFAAQLDVKEAFGGLLPQDKVEHVEALRRNPACRVAFVGDGINDAPVLALSHVGIAMGGLGSDAAVETADVVIQTDQPSRVATAIRIGRRTRRIVWQNVGMAIGIKVLVMVLGAFGVATLWEAVFADVGVALLAILNAMRLSVNK